MVTRKRVTVKQLERSLAMLGKNKGDIALKLKRLKVRGVMGKHKKCAIAVYLKQRHPGHTVSVGNRQVVVNGATVPTWRSIQEFIISFDDGVFPDLLTPASKKTLDSRQ